MFFFVHPPSIPPFQQNNMSQTGEEVDWLDVTCRRLTPQLDNFFSFFFSVFSTAVIFVELDGTRIVFNTFFSFCTVRVHVGCVNLE